MTSLPVSPVSLSLNTANHRLPKEVCFERRKNREETEKRKHKPTNTQHQSGHTRQRPVSSEYENVNPCLLEALALALGYSFRDGRLLKFRVGPDQDEHGKQTENDEPGEVQQPVPAA